jgi:hypothetical protein
MFFKILWEAIFRLSKEEEYNMGKKHRSRINSPKKNNHIPAEAIIAEHDAHAKEHTATGGRKNNH